MKLKTILECIKCFMIGDDRDTKNDIERMMYPNEKQSKCYSEDQQLHQTLYIPPEESYGDQTNISRKSDNEIDDEGSVDVNHSESSQSIGNKIDESSKHDKNGASLPIITRIIELITELDMTKSKLINTESIEIISFCQNRIIESIVSCSGDLINNDTIYSNERHVPMPFMIVPNGSTIKKVLRPGIIVNKKVLLKAIVQLDI